VSASLESRENKFYADIADMHSQKTYCVKLADVALTVMYN